MVSQFCTELTIGKVHNLLLYKDKKNVAREIEKTLYSRRIKFSIFLMGREIIFNFSTIKLQFTSLSQQQR